MQPAKPDGGCQYHGGKRDTETGLLAYCGEATQAGSYCARHRAVMFMSDKDRPKRTGTLTLSWDWDLRWRTQAKQADSVMDSASVETDTGGADEAAEVEI